MRRFLIWTALAAIVGVLLAGGGYWAYWTMYARFQPVTITENQAEIQRLLDASPYVSAESGGTPMYIVGYRDSTATQGYAGAEAERLRAAGVEPRILLFARPDRDGQPQSSAAERATVAELWLSRDWSLYERWMATPPANWTAAGLPPADGNLTRTAIIDGGREFAERLGALLDDAGVPTRYPLVIWRDPQGFLKACACSDRRAWPFIRDDLGASERASNDTAPDAPEGPTAPDPTAPTPGQPPVAADNGPGTQPYPKLEEILPAPTPRYAPEEPATVPAPAQPSSTGSQPRQTAPTTPTRPATRPSTPPAERPATAPRNPSRQAPQPKRDDESTFF